MPLPSVSVEPLYPRDAADRLRYERTAYDTWYRSKEGRLARPFYYHHQPRHERAFVRSIVRAHGMPPGARLIDIGCGNGFYADAFAAAGLKVTAVDLSEAAIDYAARTRSGDVTWMSGDALSLPFEGEFDYAFCHYFTLFNAAEVPAEAAEYGRTLMRYLRPGGTLFFVWHSDLTAVRLAGERRFGIMNYTIRQIEAMFADFSTTAHAIDGRARLAHLGRFAYNKYVTRLCCAWVYMAASTWDRVRIVVGVHNVRRADGDGDTQ